MVKIPIGISFDEGILGKIDKDRGDIPRSKYIIKVLEKEYTTKNIEKIMRYNSNSLEGKTANLHYSSEFTNP